LGKGGKTISKMINFKGVKNEGPGEKRSGRGGAQRYRIKITPSLKKKGQKKERK